MGAKSTVGLVCGLLLLSAGAQAAHSFSPKSTSFTGKGKVTVSKGVTHPTCDAHLTGDTDAAGNATVSSLTFSGSTFCSSEMANSPLGLTAEAKRRALLHSIFLSTPVGNCGPGDVAIYVNSFGKFTLATTHLNPDCYVNGHLNTTPPITIVKP